MRSVTAHAVRVCMTYKHDHEQGKMLEPRSVTAHAVRVCMAYKHDHEQGKIGIHTYTLCHCACLHVLVFTRDRHDQERARKARSRSRSRSRSRPRSQSQSRSRSGLVSFIPLESHGAPSQMTRQVTLIRTDGHVCMSYVYDVCDEFFMMHTHIYVCMCAYIYMYIYHTHKKRFMCKKCLKTTQHDISECFANKAA
jgi:hypothetical protein